MPIDGLLLISLSVLCGATAALHPLPAGVAALAVAALLRKRSRRLVLLTAAVGFGFGALRAHYTLAEFERTRIAARDAIGTSGRCAVNATIIGSPTSISGTLRYIVEVRSANCEGRQLHTLRARLYGGPSDLSRGDVIHAVTQLGPIQIFRNFDMAQAAPGMARVGVVLSGSALSVSVTERGNGWRAYVDRARAHARERIDETFVPAAAPMARALVLGENDLADGDDEAFKKSGLAHLLAVSGTHLVFAVVALVRALTALLVRLEPLSARYDVGRFSAAAGMGLALLYADFSGGTGSAWRAAWMLCAAFAVRAAGRRVRPSRVLGASLLVGATLDSLAVFDLSFLLSAAATSGLLLASRPLTLRCRRIASRPLRYLALSVGATVAAMLPCAPLLALLSTELTLAGIAANVIAAPFGEALALPLCLSHSLMTPLPALERGTALAASGALLLVRKVAHLSAAATWSAVDVPFPGPWHLALLGVAVIGALSWFGQARLGWLLGAALALASVELSTKRVGAPRGLLRVTVLDVGQGDSTLVDLPDGRIMLVDGGGFVKSPIDPGRSVILPVLRARRRQRVDIAVLSHPHPDHFGGLASALPKLEVGELWDSGQGETERAGAVYEEMLKGLRQRGVNILRPAELCNRPRHFAGATVEVLAPCPSFVPQRNANDNSLVLRIRYGQTVVLLTGDAEAEQEHELVSTYGNRLRADLLKAGHHGSRTSSNTEFLRWVRPQIATVSSGMRNRFGHPHAVALERLRAFGALPLRIDRVGSVIWQTDGESISVRAFGYPR